MSLLQSSIEKLPVRSTMKVTAEQQTTIILSVSRYVYMLFVLQMNGYNAGAFCTLCDRCDDVNKLYPVVKDLARLYR